MANNINGIFGYGYGVRYLNNGQQNKDLTTKTNAEDQAPAEQPQQTTNVDPNEVLNFLASSSVKVETPQAPVVGDNAETAERVEGYIQNFEMIYSIVSQEFGDDVANTLLNDDQFVDALMA